MKIRIPKHNNKDIKHLTEDLNINEECAKVLLNRKLDKNVIEVITNNNFYDSLPNDSIKGISDAAKVIARFLEKDTSHIYIYGDYDNDGIQSTYIAYDCLKVLTESLDSKCQIHYHIPEREEGYGLSAEWCFELVHNDIPNDNILVLTVDNGIAKGYEIDYLQDNNIEVVVTDHHVPQEGLIPNCIVIDELIDDENEYMGLCGAGVIYKLCSYLLVDYYGDDSGYNEYYLPNVMTATISDMVPASLENSIFIRNGLYMLNDKNIECSDSFEYYMQYRGYKKLIPKDIAFEYGPQINACGRMGNANSAMDFLLEDTEIRDMYNKVVNYNDERKDKTKNLVVEAIPNIDESSLVTIIISNNAGGCAGLLANKLMEMYNRPTIVFSEHKDTYSGSARSIEGIDLQTIFKYLQEQNIVVSFGGHSKACGVEVSKDKLDLFKDSMNNIIYTIIQKAQEKAATTEIEEPMYYADRQLNASEISKDTVKEYKDILFYNDLNVPKFYLENINISIDKRSKNNPNNIKFALSDKTGKNTAWCWGFGETYEELGSPKKVNILCELELFNGQIVMNIKQMETA